MKQLERIIIMVQLGLILCLPLASWTASVLGYPTQNLLSGESVRWFSAHIADALGAPLLPLAILLLSALGAVQECGIMQHKIGSRRLWPSLCVFLIVGFMLALPTFLPHNALLSVTGELFPSPWFASLPYALCLNIMLSATVYAISNRRREDEHSLTNLFTSGLCRHSLWLYIFMMGHFIFELISHITQP